MGFCYCKHICCVLRSYRWRQSEFLLDLLDSLHEKSWELRGFWTGNLVSIASHFYFAPETYFWHLKAFLPIQLQGPPALNPEKDQRHPEALWHFPCDPRTFYPPCHPFQGKSHTRIICRFLNQKNLMKFLIFLVTTTIRHIKIQTYKSILSTIEWGKNANVKKQILQKRANRCPKDNSKCVKNSFK